MSLQKALNTTSCTEVWVAQGTYKPTSGTDRSISFNIRPNVQVYGGFAGNETTRALRDPTSRLTILSGDIGVPGDNADNSTYVVLMDGSTGTGIIDTNTVLDGFTIRDGNASVDPTYENAGGGLRCVGRGGQSECSPSLRQLRFIDNFASYGAGLYNDGQYGGRSNPVLNDVSFINNTSRFSGGAMYNDGYAGTSSPTLTNVTFTNNKIISRSTSSGGGAMKNDGSYGGTSSPVLNHVTFIDNTAQYGGAMQNYTWRGGESSPHLNNVTFSGNHAGASGGAIMSEALPSSESSPVLTNVSFVNNSAARQGGAMYSVARSGISSPVLNSVTFSNNSAQRGGAMSNLGTDNPDMGSESSSSPGESSPILSNVTFSGNIATHDGGAIHNEAGAPDSTRAGISKPELTNVTLHGNSASRGGAIYNLSHAGGTVQSRLVNVILWGNTAPTNPQVHSNSLAQISVSFSVVQGGCNSIPYATCAQTNLISNPRLRPLANNGGFTKTMLVTSGSSAVNTGYLDACVKPNVNGVDQRGVSRPQGSTNQCDIGAVEVTPSELHLLFRDGFEAD